MAALPPCQRILNMHVIPGRDISSLVAQGVGLSYSGDFLKFENNTLKGEFVICIAGKPNIKSKNKYEDDED